MNDEEWVKTRNFKMLNYVFIKKSKISNSKKLISSLSNSIQCYVPRRTFNQWKILIFQEPVPVILYFLKIGPKFFITFEFLKGYGFARNFPDFQSLDASSSVKCKNYFWGILNSSSSFCLILKYGSYVK
jgi:hypothetical protein